MYYKSTVANEGGSKITVLNSPPASMEINESALIKECKAGRMEAFGPLYDSYINKIYRYIFYRLRDKEESKDLTSRIFLKAIDKINTYDPDRGNFSSWIYRIARNTLFDHWKESKQKIETAYDAEELEKIPGASSPRKDAETNEQIKAMLKELDKFSPEQRDIVLLRVWDGLSYREISEATGKSEANCQMIFSRTISKLQKNLGPAFLIFLLLAKNNFL